MNTYNLTTAQSLGGHSSGGMLLKWVVGGKFIKTSTMDSAMLTNNISDRFMYGSYAEVIACHIAKWLGFESIEYRLANVSIDGYINTVACESSDFRKEQEEFISIAELMRKGILPIIPYGSGEDRHSLLVRTMNKYLPAFKKYLDQTLIVDYIILNDDRHYGNFGVLRDIKGNIKPAPIFDSGNSCFCHKHISGLRYNSKMSTYLVNKPFYIDFEKQIGLVDKRYYTKNNNMSRNIANLLAKLEKQGLPEERSEFIRAMLLDRVKLLDKALGG